MPDSELVIGQYLENSTYYSNIIPHANLFLLYLKIMLS